MWGGKRKWWCQFLTGKLHVAVVAVRKHLNEMRRTVSQTPISINYVIIRNDRFQTYPD